MRWNSSAHNASAAIATRYALVAIAALVLSACGASITPMKPRGEIEAVSVPTPVIENNDVASSDVVYFSECPLMVPVVGITPDKIPDTFNEARDGGERTHRATDILAQKGTPVVAAANGRILRLSRNAKGGITIYQLDDKARFLYYYAHLDKYSELTSAGATVRQGDVLGYVGMTGNAPVPHLHFQAMRWEATRRDYWNCPAVDVRPYFTLTGMAR